MNKISKLIFSLILINGIINIGSAQESDSSQVLETDNINVIKSFEAKLVETPMVKLRIPKPQVPKIERKYEYIVSIIPYEINYPSPIIRPIAMKRDPPTEGKQLYTKIGYGSLQNTLARISGQHAFSDIVDWRFNLEYDNATGNDLELQEFDKLNVKTSFDFTAFETTRINATLSGGTEGRSFYYNGEIGFPEAAAAENLRRINKFGVNLESYNIEENSLKLDYSINAGTRYTRLTDKKVDEVNTFLDIQLTKRTQKNIAFSLSGRLDNNEIDAKNSTIYVFSPHLTWSNKNLGFNLGASILNTGSESQVFPQGKITLNLDKDKLKLFIGSSQSFYRNNLNNITSLNPFIDGNLGGVETSITQNIFAGVNGKIFKLKYHAEGGYKNIQNHHVFNIEYSDQLRRMNVSTSDVKSPYISGTLTYPVKTNFNIYANLTQNFFTDVESTELWHIPSFELNLKAELKYARNKLLILPNLFLRDRVNYLNPEGENQELNDLIDLNLEIQYKLFRAMQLWARGNNLTNRKYERWFGYENLGINVQGGFILLL